MAVAAVGTLVGRTERTGPSGRRSAQIRGGSGSSGGARLAAAVGLGFIEAGRCLRLRFRLFPGVGRIGQASRGHARRKERGTMVETTTRTTSTTTAPKAAANTATRRRKKVVARSEKKRAWLLPLPVAAVLCEVDSAWRRGSGRKRYSGRGAAGGGEGRGDQIVREARPPLSKGRGLSRETSTPLRILCWGEPVLSSALRQRTRAVARAAGVFAAQQWIASTTEGPGWAAEGEWSRRRTSSATSGSSSG